MAKSKRTNDGEGKRGRTQRRPLGWVGVVRRNGQDLPGFYFKVLDPATGRRVQRWGGDDRDAAVTAMTKFLGEKRPDPATGRVRRSLGKLIEEFLEVAEGEVSAYHRGTLEEQLARFRKSVGDVALERVNRATVESYMRALARQDGKKRAREVEGEDGKVEREVVISPMSANTQRRHLSAIGRLFAFALDRHYVEANPARGIRLRKVQQHEPVVLTAEQLAALYVQLPARIRDLTIFLGETGARRDEGRTLQWAQVAADDSAVTFTATKNRKNRRVRLTARVAGVLRALREQRVRPMRGEDPVFPYVSTSEAARQFRQAVKSAGLAPETTMHSLRHSLAVALTMGGVPFSVTCEVLGHHSPAFTAARYARWVPDGAADRALAALEAARAPAPVASSGTA